MTFVAHCTCDCRQPAQLLATCFYTLSSTPLVRIQFVSPRSLWLSQIERQQTSTVGKSSIVSFVNMTSNASEEGTAADVIKQINSKNAKICAALLVFGFFIYHGMLHVRYGNITDAQ